MAWGTQWRSAARIVVAYAAIASLWILLSDRLLYLIQPDPQVAMRWAMYKGWAFVVVTATLLAIVLLAEGRSLSRSHEALLSADRRMREAQDLVQLALEGAGIGVWRHDFVSGGVLLDERARAHFGLNGHETTIEAFLACIHPLDAERTGAEMRAQTRPDASGSFATEFRVLHADGTVRWIAFGVRVWYESAGSERRARRAFGVTQDVTDRRTAETALRESETRFRQVSEHVGEWVWEVDADGLYTYASPVVEKVLGYRPEEMVRRMHFYDLFPPDQREAQKTAAFAHFHEAKPFVRFRNETRHKDGHVVVSETSGTPIVDANGLLRGFLGVDDDITDRERLEAQYLRAQRLEGIGALASGIAHDLNNILAPIRMVVPLVREATQDPESRAMLDTIETSAERGADIIKQLLTFARGRPGVRVPMPLRHLVRDMAKIVRETFPRDIQARTDVPAELWPLLGDATQLHQALMNLCVNSRDAMPDGGVLTIAARNATVDAERAAMHRDAAPGEYVCLSVSDTGEGIPGDHFDRIFDPFFTTKEIGHGTGLGLATVLGIVRGHGGFILVETAPGHGTTFEMYFPAASHHDALAPAVPDTLPRLGAGELILVVDDEAAVRTTICTALEASGYRVAMATDGADGLRVFQSCRADVKAVLTDMMMPVMNGPTMIGRLRALVPHLVVVGMTGLPERSGVKGLDTLEVTSLLTKPFSVDELLRTLEAALHGPPPAAADGA